MFGPSRLPRPLCGLSDGQRQPARGLLDPSGAARPGRPAPVVAYRPALRLLCLRARLFSRGVPSLPLRPIPRSSSP